MSLYHFFFFSISRFLVIHTHSVIAYPISHLSQTKIFVNMEILDVANAYIFFSSSFRFFCIFFGRPKIQAQRKFAQIYGGSTTSSLPSNLTASNQASSSSSTQHGASNGQNHDSPQELLPNRRPNTEDFLTFLCFRGTSVLPSHLDFFNTNKTTTATAPAATSVSTATAAIAESNAATVKSTKVGKSEASSSSGSASASAKVAVKKEEEAAIITAKPVEKEKTQLPPPPPPPPPSKEKKEDPTATAPPATFIPFAVRKRADTVATGTRREKVQALKKKYQDQRIAKNNQIKCKTRSSTAAKNNVETKTKMQQKKPIAKEVRNGKNEENAVEVTVKKVKRKLRGNSNVNEDDDDDDHKVIASKSQKTVKESNARAAVTEKKKVNNKMPAQAAKTQVTQQKSKQKQEDVVEALATRTTRHKSYSLPNVKLSKSVNEMETEEKSTTKKAKGKLASKSMAEADFSSDDDRPLLANEKKKGKVEKAVPAVRKLKRQSANAERDASTDRKSDISSKVSEPAPKRKSKPTAAPLVAKKSAVTRKSVATPNMDSTQEDTDDKETTKKVRRKRRNEFTDLSQTDQSEPETKVGGRPMRKTKEAAAIYMELIGQKLNLSDCDDDNFSMDSFPELPNVRKTEQMENELRLNLSKEKPTVKGKASAATATAAATSTSATKKDAKNSFLDNSTALDAAKPKVSKETVDSTKATKPGTAKKPATPVSKAKTPTEPPKKLQKSFSDSDDEPLATKVERRVKTPKKKRKSDADAAQAPPVVLKVEAPPAAPTEPSIEVECKTVAVVTHSTPIKIDVPASLPVKKESNQQPLAAPTVKAAPTTPKSIDLNNSEFKMPAESVTQLLSPPINVSPIKPVTPREFGAPKFKTTTTSKESIQSSPSAKNSTQSISAILADLNSSKEDGKIFGIASVTLAQSSGPNDTKCTLGKCGSVHKPSLGPVVPTESYFGEQLTSKERRKAKVNMTHEQIEKWLLECSLNADTLENDLLDDEELDLSQPPKPVNYMSTPSPFRDRDNNKEGSPSSSLSKSKDKLTTTPKTSLPKSKLASTDAQEETSKTAPATVTKTPADDKPKQSDGAAKKADSDKKGKESKVKETPPAPAPAPATDSKSASPSTTTVEVATPRKPSPQSSAAANTSTKSTPIDKKPIYNRRTPVYKKPEPAPAKPSPAAVVNSFGAFSPENEASVYSFDKEEDTIPTSVPFRRHGRRTSNEEPAEKVSIATKKSVAASKINDKSPPSVAAAKKSTASPAESNSKPAPTAKKVTTQAAAAINEKATKETTKRASNTKEANVSKGASTTKGATTTKGVSTTKEVTEVAAAAKEEDDSEGHTFYIPLQCMGGMAGSSDQMIQGVAVKLGTEGPEGPNQKVIMHAKLVTKSQMGANTTPLPEGMANVHDIVKSLIANKDAAIGSKSVAIGTVQQRLETKEPIPSSSIATANTSNHTEPAPKSSVTLPRQNSNQSLKDQKTNTANAKNVKRASTKVDGCTIQPSNNTAFPRYDDPAQMVDAPVFRPTEKEFQDPIEFISRIMPVAARFGLCRIIPPSSFKPECKISDDMRFTAYNQYVHKMLHRWGPSAKELNAIKKYLATQSIKLTQPPLIGGMEVDLPRLYHTVQESGGLKEVIEKKKWAKVAEEMCIPKAAQDRVTKLDDIYCKYLLPYDTLSPKERQKLFDEVEADWAKSEAKALRNADRTGTSDSNSNENSDELDGDSDDDDDEDEEESGDMECIVKGKSMALSAFFRVARNTMALWFKNTDPTSAEIESEFWRHVAVRDSHVCVHSGSIDSSGWGYGFPSPGPKTKNSTCSKHPWNLKVLTNNHNSILRSIGPVTGVTVPTLHVGMLFSACCWYRDPHGLPWIEYLHTGGSKIWYSVPYEQSSHFRAAFTSLVPTHCQNKTVWLPCDTAMVPPHMLTDRGVSLCRTEQEPGQFVVVFPRAYTSNICTGYSISESVYFAPMSWLETAKEDFKVRIEFLDMFMH